VVSLLLLCDGDVGICDGSAVGGFVGDSDGVGAIMKFEMVAMNSSSEMRIVWSMEMLVGNLI